MILGRAKTSFIIAGWARINLLRKKFFYSGIVRLHWADLSNFTRPTIKFSSRNLEFQCNYQLFLFRFSLFHSSEIPYYNSVNSIFLFVPGVIVNDGSILELESSSNCWIFTNSTVPNWIFIWHHSLKYVLNLIIVCAQRYNCSWLVHLFKWCSLNKSHL